jgi:hypothetical protein
MCIRRLRVLALLILFCVATVAAQSPSDKSTDASQPSAHSVESKNDSLAKRADTLLEHFVTLQQDEAMCYTMRTYRVARVSPESDTTTPAGYSTCQRAARFQLRTTVQSVEIAPR